MVSISGGEYGHLPVELDTLDKAGLYRCTPSNNIGDGLPALVELIINRKNKFAFALVCQMYLIRISIMYELYMFLHFYL